MCDKTSHQRLELRLVPEKLGLQLAFVLLHFQDDLGFAGEFLLHRVQKGNVFSFHLLCSFKLCENLLVLDSELLVLLLGE